MASNSSSSNSFGTQSADLAAGSYIIPDEWFVTNSEVFDDACVSTKCEDDCLEAGKRTTECKVTCTDSACQAYVNKIKATTSTASHGSNDIDSGIASSFNIWAQKRQASEASRAQVQKTELAPLQYTHKINNQRYTIDGVQEQCYTYCGEIKGEWFENYCKKWCISSKFQDIASKGGLDFYKIK